jgi:hypothetical protein
MLHSLGFADESLKVQTVVYVKYVADCFFWELELQGFFFEMQKNCVLKVRKECYVWVNQKE